MRTEMRINMKLSQMAAEAAANYEYDIIMAKVNGKLTEISDRENSDTCEGGRRIEE